MRVLELNDAGIRLSEAGRVILESPGHAAVEGRSLHVGEAGRARQRLDPRRCHDRFWYQLDAGLTAPMASARSAADLAHAHLLGLGSELTARPLLIAAPASFTSPQLGVLLGLLQALGAHPLGLVDAALAAALEARTQRRVVHVDVQLHRFVFTVLEGEAELQRQHSEEHKPGLAAIQERCLSVFAEAFVRQTRFDPLHSARTEQALFDRMPGWLAQLQRQPSLVLELEAGGRTHRASLGADTLAGALAERHRSLAESLSHLRAPAGATTVLLSDRAASVPGLASALAPVLSLDPLAVTRGALLQAPRIATEGAALPWVTRLPRQASVPLSPVAELPVPAAGQPTHALLGHLAQALPEIGQTRALSSWLPAAPGLLRRTGDGIRLENAQDGPVRVNGREPGVVQVLRLGDAVSANGHELRLIEVTASG